MSDENVRIVSGMVVWKGGTWKDGTWKGGTWEWGIWNGGLWEGGTWEGGNWKGGTWEDGIWEDGIWEDGAWYDGTWYGGTWKDGIWYGGTWKGGLWNGGTWNGGTWKRGTWLDKKNPKPTNESKITTNGNSMKITKSQLREIIREEIQLLERTDYSQNIETSINAISTAVQKGVLTDNNFKAFKTHLMSVLDNTLKSDIQKMDKDKQKVVIDAYKRLVKYIERSTSFDSLISNMRKTKGEFSSLTNESTLNELNIKASFQKVVSAIKAGAGKGASWLNNNKGAIVTYIIEILVEFLSHMLISIVTGGKSDRDLDLPTFKGKGGFGSGGGGASSKY